METPAPLMLSISGLRGIVGDSLTPEVASRYACAIGTHFCRTRGAAPLIVVGRDSRPSGAMLESALVAGLLATGCRVTQVGILSTPGVAHMVKTLQADGGVVLTASHNPTPWNGIKCLRHDAVAPPAEEAQCIIDSFTQNDFDLLPADQLTAPQTDDTGVDSHTHKVLGLLTQAGAIRRRKFRVVVDAVNGAGGAEARALLGALDAEIIPMWLEPTGQFPHTPEPTRDNLGELCERVREEKADLGFALDPDADRLAIVDQNGQYIGEEYTLALCVLHKLEPAGVAVANLSTSRMIDDIALARGGRIVRTGVGEANVAQGMRDNDAKLGGEGNGGLMFPAISQVRDSFLAMAFVLELLAIEGASLSEIAKRIPCYAMIKDKVPANPEIIAQIKTVLPDAFDDADADCRDGVRLDWQDRWVHVRASNTEPIIRLIAEAPDEQAASELIADCAKALGLMYTTD